MHLVMFDIDGTLTETMQVDADCFVRSFKEVFGVAEIDTNWSHYPHCTDSGIFHHIFTSRIGRAPTEPDVLLFRQHLVRLLTAASLQSTFAPIKGANQILLHLSNSDSHRVCLATGAWSDSARIKMASAGMCFDDFPSASADDAFDRESIMRLSIQRATERYAGPFSSTIYVGDAIWDARACRALSVPFIGIGSGERARRLASEGAVRVFQDFSEPDLFLECLDEIASTANLSGKSS
jgi:phosphoglycolate phosphatase-like HAD superfamily hydrolase